MAEYRVCAVGFNRFFAAQKAYFSPANSAHPNEEWLGLIGGSDPDNLSVLADLWNACVKGDSSPGDFENDFYLDEAKPTTCVRGQIRGVSLTNNKSALYLHLNGELIPNPENTEFNSPRRQDFEFELWNGEALLLRPDPAECWNLTLALYAQDASLRGFMTKIFADWPPSYDLKMGYIESLLLQSGKEIRTKIFGPGFRHELFGQPKFEPKNRKLCVSLETTYPPRIGGTSAPPCEHHWVNAGFTSFRLVCSKCNIEKPRE